LNKNPDERLGTKGGLQEIIEHKFFDDLDFDKLLKKEIVAPFKPQLSANLLDTSNFDDMFTSEEAVNSVIPQN